MDKNDTTNYLLSLDTEIEINKPKSFDEILKINEYRFK